MTSEPGATLVVGAGGLLGRAVVRELAARRRRAVSAVVRWSSAEHVDEDLRTALRTVIDDADGGTWKLVWCAGAGVTSTSPQMLEDELRTLRTFVTTLTSLPTDVRTRGVVFFASSAGGVYAGAATPPFDETSTPAPLAPYGHAKLRAEKLLTEAAASGLRVVVGRISNIYGPGQNLAKPQGLVSQLCLSHHTARPVGIYVSMDTLRDYLFVDDCAGFVLDVLDRAATLEPGAPAVTKILASQQSVSIATLIGEVRRIFKRRPLVVLAASKHAKQQARDLRFRSVVWPDLDRRGLTPLVAGIATTGEDVGRDVRAGRP